MKKISFFLLLSGLCVQGWTQNADPDINILAQPGTVQIAKKGILNVSVCNNGSNRIVSNSLIATVTIGTNIQILGIHTATSDARFTQQSLSAGNGNTITLTNTGVDSLTSAGGTSPCASVDLDVMGAAVSGPTDIIGTVDYIVANNPLLGNALNSTQGNNPNNDESHTTVGVALLLPVKLVSFAAAKTGNAAYISWTYNSAVNFSYFELEHSTDGQRFTSLNGKHYPAGSAADAGALLSLNETDTKPASGANYYRLKMVDTDGDYSYSFVVTLSFSGQREGVTLYPNPVRGDMVTIAIPALSSTGRIKVYSVFGTVVYEGVATARMQLNTSALVQGTYVA